MNKIICIKNISIDKNIVNANIEINKNIEVIKTEINETCVQYICIDRIDAYVIGLLYFALKNGYDFQSTIPISESLFYNLNYHYIDALVKGNPHLHRVIINAPTISEINELDKKGNLIATGISCGVDSLYTIAMHTQLTVPYNYRVNTLCFFNVGAAMKTADELDNYLSKGRYELAKSFAEEYNYKFIHIESNIHFIIHKYSPSGYSHVENHTFMALFCIYHIQYGIKKYYYSSGHSISEFSINNKNNKEFDSAFYDLFTLRVASINNMQIYSTGSNINRLEKVRVLNNYPPSYKYLNVCTNEVKNDGICFKCERTLLEIDAIGDIEKFKYVFDIDYYKENINKYLSALYRKAILKKDPFYMEIYPYLKDKISLHLKIKTIFSIIKNRLKRC